jgi:hypothetical protein
LTKSMTMAIRRKPVISTKMEGAKLSDGEDQQELEGEGHFGIVFRPGDFEVG